MSEVPSLPRTPNLADAVREIFSDRGALAQVIPAFESRSSQREMAAAVADVFDHGGVLLAEAETGTGKTLAYLTPAILSRQRVLISTGTKNLQEQIYFKDLPILREVLGIPFTATYMKGRSNYLCLHRFEALRDPGEGLVDRPRSASEHVFLPIIERWAATTDTGDRAEIEDLPEDLPFWSDIAASAENCLGTECPRYDECFVTRMRQRAADSDLVIVNHHLLCADTAVRQSAFGEVIPACSHAVIDEAHQLEDVATQYFGMSISNYRCDDLARDAERLLARRLIVDERDELRQAIDRIRDRAGLFFGVIVLERDTHRSRPGGDDRVRLTPQFLSAIADHGASLIGALDVFEATTQLMTGPRPVGSPPADEGLSEDLAALARRAGELRDELRFILRASDGDYVYFLERRGRGVFLRASPIDVSAIVREMLLDRLRGTVLTSATLTVDGSFDYLRSRLGIRGAQEIRLTSEFDYARQAILYLPRRMPDPRDPGFGLAAAREVIEILQRTEGRAFVLFTSYVMLREVQVMAEAALHYPILVQGTAPRTALLRQFRSTAHSVLLATSSFWQGVDVIGEALSCVIVDKLPFASPADPVTAARIEAITDRGGQPFADYQVPIAILSLKQGLGRLIRHRNDRGVLSILDPRVRTMAYGRRFLESLPPAPITSNLADIDRFFSVEG